MKIIKYLLLLVLLSFIATTIFVATLNPYYKVVRTQIVNSPRSTVFNYINNLKNWEDFDGQKQNDPKMKFIFNNLTIGKGALCKFKSQNGNGIIQTINVKQNETISQNVMFKGNKTEVFWNFKDTLHKTKITYITIGKFGFWEKMIVNFTGGTDSNIGITINKSLSNINRNLDFELHNYQVVVKGYLQKSGCIYLHKTIGSKNENVAKNISIIIKNLTDFASKNNFILNGKPFVIYNIIDDVKKVSNISVCLPLKIEYFVKQESGYSVSKLPPFQAVKVTLTGDYSHFVAAKMKSLEYFYTYKLVDDNKNRKIEVYVKTKNDIKNPSQWITEIYYPAKPKSVNIIASSQINDSTGTQAVELPAPNIAKPN